MQEPTNSIFVVTIEKYEYLDEIVETVVVEASGGGGGGAGQGEWAECRLRLCGADLAGLHGRAERGAAHRALARTVAPAPQDRLDLARRLTYDAVLVRLLQFRQAGPQKLLELVYGLVLQLPPPFFVVTLIAEKNIGCQFSDRQ